MSDEGAPRSWPEETPPPIDRAPGDGVAGRPEFAPARPTPDAAHDQGDAHRGGLCAVHPDEAAAFTCDRCGSFGCGACRFGGMPAPGVERAAFCVACARDGLDEPIPWERRAELGWWRAFVETTRLASMHPTRFFRTPTLERGAMGGLLYGVAANCVGQFALFVVLGVSLMLGGAVAGAAVDPLLGTLLAGYGCFLVGLTPLFVVQAPIQAVFGILVATAGSHGTLALGGRTSARFEDTLRAMGYATAPHVWVWLPACGVPLTYAWMLAVEYQAIRGTHRVSGDAAAVAIFGYRAVLLLGVLAIYAAFFLLVVLYAPTPAGLHAPGTP